MIVAEILFNEDLESFEVFMQDTYKVIRKYKWKILTTFAVAAFLIFAMTFLIGFDEVITTDFIIATALIILGVFIINYKRKEIIKK